MSKFNFTRTGFPVRVNRFYGKDNHAPRKLTDLVEQIEIGYPNGCANDPSDAFVQYAEHIATGKPLTEAELDALDIAEASEAVA